MEKFYEKKNLGIPVVILSILAYIIGYTLIFKLDNALIAAIIFAAIVFGLQFDDSVKSAVKQSYIIAFLAKLVFLGFELYEYLISFFVPKSYNIGDIFSGGLGGLEDIFELTMYGPKLFYKILVGIDTYGKIIVSALLTVLYFIFILQAIRGKEFKIGFISVILGDIPRKAPAYKPPVTPPQTPSMQYTYGQPQGPAPQAPVQPQTPAPQATDQPQASAPQAPAQPQATVQQQEQAPALQGKFCPSCGKPNKLDALFCSSCGTKL